MSWLLAFLGFAALIVLHELGHFAAAKAVGMRVERFALFFPPLWAEEQRGETEYAIGSIPLGGYVKITGMNPAEEIPPEVAHRAYFRQPVWKRIVVIAAGPAVNIVIAFVICWPASPAPTAPRSRRRASRRSRPGSPAAGVLKPGDVIVAVDGKRPAGDTLRRPERRRSPSRSPPTSAQATARLPAATPAASRCRSARDGAAETLHATPVYDADAKRPLLGFTLRRHRRTPAGPVARGRS